MDILDIYPIGSIVEFVSNIDPNVLYGGTWVQDTSNTILVCQNTATFSGSLNTYIGSDTATAGYPAHIHRNSCRGIVAGTATGTGEWGSFHVTGSTVKNIPNTNNRVYEYYGEGRYTASTIGGGASHENRMRSLGVYRWIRTA